MLPLESHCGREIDARKSFDSERIGPNTLTSLNFSSETILLFTLCSRHATK